jgi:hypothetical protein
MYYNLIIPYLHGVLKKFIKKNHRNIFLHELSNKPKDSEPVSTDKELS